MTILIFLFLAFCAGTIIFLLFSPADQSRATLHSRSLWPVLVSGIVASSLAFYIEIKDIFHGEADKRAVTLLIILCFVFIATGGNLLYELYVKRRMEHSASEKFRKQYPDSPWMWDKRWQSGSIIYSNKGEVVVGWIVASVIIGALLTLYILKQQHSLEWLPDAPWGDRCIDYTMVMFGLYALRYAVNSTMKWLEFGIATFAMSPFPGIIGEKLEGVVQTRCRRVSSDGFDVSLACIELDISFRESPGEILENVLWESKKIVRVENVYMGPRGVCFPVVFSIPDNVSETDTLSRGQRVQWVLRIAAGDSSHPFHALFKIPVFREKRARMAAPEDAAEPVFLRPEKDGSQVSTQ